MKKITTTILILLAYCTYATAQSGETTDPVAITSETNTPRPGDRIEKIQIQPIPLTQSGDSLLWDLSGYKTGKKHMIRYICSHDNRIIAIESNSSKYYNLSGDTLYLTRHGQPGMSVSYQVPEPVTIYPMSYGSHISAYFYGEGNLGNINYIRNAGYSSSDIDGRGILITPDNDTIRNVLRSHYKRTGTTHIDDNFRHSFMTTRDSTMFSGDSIRRWLATDSVIHHIDCQRWYAPGYRYPIAEAETYKIFHYGTPVDSVSRYYYYRAVYQEYDINDDTANELIRYNNNVEEWYADGGSHNQSSGGNYGNGTKKAGGKNGSDKSRKPSGTQDGSDDRAASGFSPIDTYPYSMAFPTIVTNNATIRYGTNTFTEVNISLHTSAAGVVWQHSESVEPGDHSVTCPMDALPAGDYLMVTRIGDETFTAKLIKK